jgi:hypothetical protein
LARAQREGKGYVKRATAQDHDSALARGSRDTRLSLGKADNSAAIWRAHASLLATFKLRNYQYLRSVSVRTVLLVPDVASGWPVRRRSS